MELCHQDLMTISKQATGKGTKNTNSDLCKKNPNHPDCKAETPKPQLVENELPTVKDEILFIL